MKIFLGTDCQTSFSLLPYTVNFVYKVVESPNSTLMCYIYTPANLDSYGLVLDSETDELYFKASKPQGQYCAYKYHGLIRLILSKPGSH